jgi:hypothetical protein
MNEHLGSVKINWINEYTQNVFDKLFAPKEKTIHDFTDQEAGINYFFDSFNRGIEGYLTSQEEKINPGVLIRLRVDKIPQTYEVRKVNFYASPADMWTAHLVKVRN